ncbi:hypothetical protein ZIOFF_041284 [Zingiber officinale]|uniref:Uncharacterized protein n=2 Tax=Zingiber officinale TaxID=94328 RepID=A0A8J5GBA2_ZINOF|nr:hypothetical protein ZIOFF_041284 [Zingiber officinale]
MYSVGYCAYSGRPLHEFLQFVSVTWPTKAHCAMSRCFPFPPPGYEKRTRSDHLDSLAEEKRKEKQRKKEKKEKKEGKEKKEKHRSKEKHKEKKDRKEKHKDKKKKDKDKDKSRAQNDRANKESQSSHRDVLGECSHKPEEIDHSKVKEELDRRIKGEQKVATNRKVECPIQKSVGSLGVATFSSSMVPPQRQVDCLEKPADKFNNSTHRKNEVSASTIQKERSTSGKLAQKLPSAGQRGNGGAPLPMESSAGYLHRKFEGLPSATSTEIDSRKSNKVPFHSGSSVQRTINGMGQSVQSLSAPKNINSTSLPIKMEGGADASKSIARSHMFAKKVDGINRPVEKDADNKSEEEKAKNKEREAGINGEEKYKNRDHDKKIKDKDKHKDREKEKAKVKQKVEQLKEQKEPGEDRKKSQLDILRLKSLGPQTDNSKNNVIDENIKKRKEADKNGFLDDTNLRPNKVQRANFSTHLHEQNGRTLGSSYIAHTSLKPEAAGNKLPTNAVGQKEHTMNGISEAKPSSAGLMHSVAAETDINRKVHASPHPDFVYLEQLYSIPKVDEYPEYDDQEWLLRSHHAQKSKSKLDACEIPQVWSEAMRIESVDTVALPYVVPF